MVESTPEKLKNAIATNLQDADFLMTMLSTSIKAIKFAKKELSEHAINKSKELKDI